MNSHPHGYCCLIPTGSLTGDFDDLKNLMSQSGNTLKVKYSFPSNGDYSQQSIALIAIIFVSKNDDLGHDFGSFAAPSKRVDTLLFEISMT